MNNKNIIPINGTNAVPINGINRSPMLNMNSMNMINPFNNIQLNNNSSNIPSLSINSSFEEIIPQNESNLNKGLEQKIINNLPETRIKEVSKLTSKTKECVICLEEFMEDEYLTFLPCIHAFHSKCIKNWLKRSKECPICKFMITNETLNYQ
jgi:hypothetical protein